MTHPWTCKIVVAYHRCPECGFVIESRKDYEKRGKQFMKDITCPRCQHFFQAHWNRKDEPRPY